MLLEEDLPEEKSFALVSRWIGWVMGTSSGGSAGAAGGGGDGADIVVSRRDARPAKCGARAEKGGEGNALQRFRGVLTHYIGVGGDSSPVPGFPPTHVRQCWSTRGSGGHEPPRWGVENPLVSEHTRPSSTCVAAVPPQRAHPPWCD